MFLQQFLQHLKGFDVFLILQIDGRELALQIEGIRIKSYRFAKQDNRFIQVTFFTFNFSRSEIIILILRAIEGRRPGRLGRRLRSLFDGFTRTSDC